jgi:iron complex outermembrane receptor protein
MKGECMQQTRWIAALVAAAVAGGAAQAQEAASASADSGELATVTVTAQKRAERPEQVPLSVNVVSADQLSAYGITSTTTLTQAVPGLNMAEVGIYLVPNIRGITTAITGPGAESNIAFYIDGIYQPSEAMNVFDLPDVDRIEVLKGPQGTLFGRNATGGAIQVFTKDPSFTPTGSIMGSAGVYDVGGGDYRGSAFLSGPLIDQVLAGSISVNYEHSDGYEWNDIFDKRLGFNNLTLHGKLLLQLSDSARFVLGAAYATRDDYSALPLSAIGGNLSARGIDPSIVAPSDGYHVIQNFLPHLKSQYYTVNLRGEFETALGKITSLTAYQDSDIYENNADSDGSPLSLVHFYNPSFDESASQEFDFASSWKGPLSLVAGLYYFHDQAAYAPLNVINVIDYQAMNTTTAKAAFTELTYAVTPRLSVVGGVRYSDEHRHGYVSVLPDPYATLGQATWTAWTPRGSVLFEVADRSNVYFTFSEGFKSGLFDTVGFNPDAIQPEHIKSYEVGFKTRGDTYSFDIAGFYYNYTDLQVGALVGPVNITQNAGKAEIAGIDSDFSWRPSRQLSLQGGISFLPKASYVNYLDADATVPLTETAGGAPCTACGNANVSINASGLRMTRAPKVTANLSATYTQPVTRGEIGFTPSVYFSSSYNLEITGRIQQAAYPSVNAELFWQQDKLRLTLWGRNLSDERHIALVQQIGATGDLVNYLAPLQVGVSASYKF